MSDTAKAYVAIGSNIEPADNVARALRLLTCEVSLTRISTVYLNPAAGRPEQPPYYNCVAAIETMMTPLELKHSVLRPIEKALGRTRSADKYAARTIDLDLIAYGEVQLRSDDCTLPDPQIFERAFLAVPLRELAPALVLPGSTLTVAAAAAGLDDGELTPLDVYTATIRRELGA